jgi:hypothetical protein
VSRFDDWERGLLRTSEKDLDAMALARSATEALVAALGGATVEARGDDASPGYFVRAALLLLSTMALRTARAALLVISAGYEPEAQGLKRRLSEIHVRAQAVTDDASGQHARDWLEGKGPSTPRKLAAKWGSLDVWEMYSTSEHADVRGLHWWLMVPMSGRKEGQHGLLVQPHRRPSFSNALLTEIAMECRDIANALATSRGGRLNGIGELDKLIEQSIQRHLQGDPPGRDS